VPISVSKWVWDSSVIGLLSTLQIKLRKLNNSYAEKVTQHGLFR